MRAELSAVLREGEGLFTREVVITAVRDGRVSSENIRRLVEERPLLRGRRELLELAEQLRGGRPQRTGDLRIAQGLRASEPSAAEPAGS